MTDKTHFLYTIFQTELGWMGLVSTERGIFASVMPQESREQAKRQLLLKLPFSPQFFPDYFKPLENELKDYFRGGNPDFNCKIDWSWATPFQKQVLQVVSLIPAGHCLTYGETALLAGSPAGARAVGGALAKNNIPVIIPCHRVISKTGLGGFTGAGLDLKARLLSLEGSYF